MSASAKKRKSLKVLDEKGMVEEFQCPGCVTGSDTECGKYEPEPAPTEDGVRCRSHVCGTAILGIGNFALGLPKGFNRCGVFPVPPDPQSPTRRAGWDTHNTMHIRLWPDGAPKWDHLNVPVWAMEEKGFLFVRTYMPRTNRNAVDVVQGGTLAMVPNAIDVGKFVDEID